MASKKTTKTCILEATECLLAEHGFESVSLRDITTAAEVNIAAVNYHFGSKERLFEEIQCRYVNPVNEERLRMLELATVNGRTAELREILEAFMRPFFTRVTRSKMSEQLFFKLMGRCIIDQQGDLPDALVPQFKKVTESFTVALHAAEPDLPVGTMLWRLHYTFGVMAHTLLHGDALMKLTQGACGDPDIEAQLQGMIDFCYAGFHAGKGGA
ncbi:MAG: TetR family transcriptional regulator [Verrucomicrobiae bacterium]|nr:TetR family transcriptional regulator [Verrucomicrobiae bacterium]NNJ43827.1 TetR/AcrR family transcriptional regulator [Akkermansiaceae bacterium]